jgi:hypothetical protein
MSSLKRKKRALDEEQVLSRAEATAFQSAFFVLDDNESTSDEAHEPLLKRQRIEKTSTNNNVPELMEIYSDDADGDGSYSHAGKQHDESPPQFEETARTMMSPHDQHDRKEPSNHRAESKNIIKKETLSFPVDLPVTHLQQVKERIGTLVSIHGPGLALDCLPSLYRATFVGDTLDYKALGFKKLKKLVQSVDSVEMELLGAGWILSLSTDNGGSPRHDPSSSRPRLLATTSERSVKNERDPRLEQVHKHIGLVVAKHSPLALNHLNRHYQAEFAGETLDHKALGFHSLNELLESLTSKFRSAIKMKNMFGEWVLILSRTMDYYSTERKAQVVSRVEAVIAKHQPLSLCSLVHRYEAVFRGDSLDYKAMGFGKLTMFVKSIDSIKMEAVGDSTHLFMLSYQPEEAANKPIQVKTERSLRPLASNMTRIDNNDCCEEPPTVAPESQGTLEPFSGPNSIAEAQVAVRLQLLVARHAPLDLSVISSLYRNSFGERLDVKTLGYGKLSSFVASIGIHLTKSGNYWLLSQSTTYPTSETAGNEVSVTNVTRRRDEIDGSGLVSKDSDALDSDSVSGNGTHDNACSQDVEGDSTLALDNATAKDNEPAFEGIAGTDDQQVETEDIAITLHIDDHSVPPGARVTESGSDVESLFILDYTGAQENKVDDSEDGLVDATAVNGTGLHHSNEPKESSVESPLPSVSHERNRHSTSSEIQRRVQDLVARHSPLDVCDLSQLYQDSYGQVLNYKSLGYGKLKSFLLSVPHITIEQKERRWYLSASFAQLGDQLRNDAVFKGGKLFGCLGCGRRSIVWGQLLNHMDTCCPDKIQGHKLQQKCRIGHKKCKVPHLEEAIPVSSAESAFYRLYGCLNCGDLQGEWMPTLQHMALCCPERIVECATDAFQRRCTIGDTMCDVPGHERRGESVRYGCPDCGKLQHSWAECLKHMQECCVILLEDKDGLMQKCRLVDENCEVQCFQKNPAVSNEEIKEGRGNNHSVEMKENQNHLNDETHTVTLSPFDLEVSRLRQLVSKYEPLLVSKVQTMYRSEYGNERLHVRGLGFASVEDFVNLIPSIKVTLGNKKKPVLQTLS